MADENSREESKEETKPDKGENNNNNVTISKQENSAPDVVEKPLDLKCNGPTTMDTIPSNSSKTCALSTLKVKVDNVLKEQSHKEKPRGDPVAFKVVFNKTKYDVEFPVEGTIKQLKEHLSPIISVLPKLMKIMIKGMAKDEKTLKELGVAKGSKIMVVGSKLDDVVNVNVTKIEVAKSEGPSEVQQKEPLCKQKIHAKIINKGPPDDVAPGIKNSKECLPFHPLSGMVNKSGGKVRLTFKLELDQIWIGTKERTEKVSMNSIHQIVSEKIEGHEEYHIMGIQLGPTEASRYWIYWMPAQYVDAIKETVLGKW